MCYMPAEILILAHGGDDCYIIFFSADSGEQPLTLEVTQPFHKPGQVYNVLTQHATQ